MKMKARYKGDSRKRNYHVYTMNEYGDKVMGNLYISTECKSAPKEFEFDIPLDHLFVTKVTKVRKASNS